MLFIQTIEEEILRPVDFVLVKWRDEGEVAVCPDFLKINIQVGQIVLLVRKLINRGNPLLHSPYTPGRSICQDSNSALRYDREIRVEI